METRTMSHHICTTAITLAVILLAACTDSKLPSDARASEFFEAECKKMVMPVKICNCQFEGMLKKYPLDDFIAYAKALKPATPEFLKDLNDTTYQCMKEHA